MKALGKTVGRTGITIIKMFLIPIFFGIVLISVGVIFNFLIDIMSNSSNPSIAQSICDACNTSNNDINFNYNFETFKQKAYVNGEYQFNFTLCILSASFLIVTLATCCLAGNCGLINRCASSIQICIFLSFPCLFNSLFLITS